MKVVTKKKHVIELDDQEVGDLFDQLRKALAGDRHDVPLVDRLIALLHSLALT